MGACIWLQFQAINSVILVLTAGASETPALQGSNPTASSHSMESCEDGIWPLRLQMPEPLSLGASVNHHRVCPCLLLLGLWLLAKKLQALWKHLGQDLNAQEHPHFKEQETLFTGRPATADSLKATPLPVRTLL